MTRQTVLITHDFLPPFLFNSVPVTAVARILVPLVFTSTEAIDRIVEGDTKHSENTDSCFNNRKDRQDGLDRKRSCGSK